jgi:hypothetical protein
MFVVENIPQNSGNSRQFTEIDLEQYASKKAESDQSSRARVQQGYSKTITSYRVAKDIGISYEMRTQNKYSEVVRRLTNLADLALNRLDLDLSLRLGFGTATTYTDMDGGTVDIALGDTLCLFSTAHTLAGSATTFRNRLANNPQLSKGALEAMERQIVENSFNHLGEKVTVAFDILWTNNIVSCGCGIDNVLEAFPHNKRVRRIAELADRWHLNGLTPGNRAQEDFLRSMRNTFGRFSYDTACAFLDGAEPSLLAVDGYKYGSAWLVEIVPDEVLAELRQLFHLSEVVS